MDIKMPVFEMEMVDRNRKDGYWVEEFFTKGKNSLPDIIGYGMNSSEIYLYQNSGWEKTKIADLKNPIGMHRADITGNGLDDIVVCHDYGRHMIECDPKGGRIVWLENPGDPNGEWKKHYVGKHIGMHRLRVGYFTQTEKLEILAFPVVGKQFDIHSDISVILYTQPEDVHNAAEWEKVVINNTYFHLIHEVSMKKYLNKYNSKLDSVLVASKEGVSWLYYDVCSNQWKIESLGIGELGQESITTFIGTGNCDAGKVGDDQFAYIAAIEPFHGNMVSVYIKDTDSELTGVKWKRIVLDTYGTPTLPTETTIGESPAHFVICADFDGDGDDEFLVGLRGPMPWEGVFYYKAIDVKKGIFAKWRISSYSVARIAIADFDGDGKLDFATIGYSVDGYYNVDDPKLIVFYNRM